MNPYNTSEIFGTKEIVYIEPGDYTLDSTYQTTRFTEQNKVYYFRAGRYKIDQIKVCSNSVFYFEKGSVSISGAARFIGNQAGRDSTDYLGNGGAIFASKNGADLTVSGDVLFEGNTARNCKSLRHVILSKTHARCNSLGKIVYRYCKNEKQNFG